MTADILKNEALKYWRFTRQGFNLCATEVSTHWGIADVMVANDREIIEVETKISYSDFVKDFSKRKYHIVRDNIFYGIDANRLFFCVPAEIKDNAVKYLLENNLPFGLFSFNGKLTMVKSCRKLKEMSLQYSEKVRRWILLRATSELIQLRSREIA